MALPPAVVDLIESGASILAGTCDDELRTDCLRSLGARVSEDRTRLTVLFNAELCARLRHNVARNPRLAVSFSRIHDHYTIQLKGRAVRVRAASSVDAATIDRYLSAFAEQVAIAGLPRSVVQTLRRSSCLAVELIVEEVFDQTPGPRAGDRYEAELEGAGAGEADKTSGESVRASR